MVAEVIIYSTLMCPYCVQAKQLLDSKGATYQEIRIDQDRDKMSEMINLSGGRRSVPQIFIDGVHVGGFDDLSALNVKGQLDVMLEGDENQ